MQLQVTILVFMQNAHTQGSRTNWAEGNALFVLTGRRRKLSQPEMHLHVFVQNFLMSDSPFLWPQGELDPDLTGCLRDQYFVQFSQPGSKVANFGFVPFA